MRLSICTLVLISGLASVPVHAGDLRYENPHLYAELRDTAFTPVFNALRAGDVTALKRNMNAPTYEEYRVLLEQNKEYGQFLRTYYAGTSFELKEVVQSGDSYVGNVAVYWPTGALSVMKIEVALESESGFGSIFGQWLAGRPKRDTRWGIHREDLPTNTSGQIPRSR